MMLNRTTPLIFALLTLSTGVLAQNGQSSFGHARARELAALGKLPTGGDIVVRDIVNYRRHLLPLPTANQAVSLDVRADRGGARRGDELWLQVGYATRGEGDRALSPPCAVTLVVDCSGSMQERGKMSQVHAGLRAFVER
ncbi:MAG: Ca-activated chloride channel family protein, partial [Planctomycetota bacterium]